MFLLIIYTCYKLFKILKNKVTNSSYYIFIFDFKMQINNYYWSSIL